MKLYKLTDENGQTRNNTQWGPGISHSGTGEGNLCSAGWIHAYEHPLLAVLLNPIHADFQNFRLWEAEGEVEKRDGQLKVGCRTLTTVKEIPLPVITTEQRVKFAILCAKTVCKDAKWNNWADAWLASRDRSEEAAAWAAEAKAAEARAATEAAEAKEAAWAAANAAWAAAANAAWAAEANAAWVAWAESNAAWAAEAAKAAAEAKNTPIDLIAIAEACLKD